MHMDRRLFLTDLSRYAALAAVVPNVWRVTTRPRFADDPFQLGVASGDQPLNVHFAFIRSTGTTSMPRAAEERWNFASV